MSHCSLNKRGFSLENHADVWFTKKRGEGKLSSSFRALRRWCQPAIRLKSADVSHRRYVWIAFFKCKTVNRMRYFLLATWIGDSPCSRKRLLSFNDQQHPSVSSPLSPHRPPRRADNNNGGSVRAAPPGNSNSSNNNSSTAAAAVAALAATPSSAFHSPVKNKIWIFFFLHFLFLFLEI